MFNETRNNLQNLKSKIKTIDKKVAVKEYQNILKF